MEVMIATAREKFLALMFLPLTKVIIYLLPQDKNLKPQEIVWQMQTRLPTTQTNTEKLKNKTIWTINLENCFNVFDLDILPATKENL